MFKSVFIKYVTAFMLINIVCMFILTTIITSTINSYSTDIKTQTLENAAVYISDYVTSGMELCSIYDMRDYVGVYSSTLIRFLNVMSVT